MGIKIATLTRSISGASSFDNVDKGETLTTKGDLISLPYLPLEDIDEVMNTEYPKDEHFITYSFETATEQICRLRKTSYGSFAMKGIKINTVAFGIDIDHPDHMSWEELGEEPEDYFEAWDAIAKEFDGIEDWRHWYTTKGGFRVVYALKDALDVTVAEKKIKWTCERIQEIGFNVDLKVFDWTRLFRLPRVVRDGKKTSEQPYFFHQFQDNYLDQSVLGESEGTNENYYVEEEIEFGDMPDPSEYEEQLSTLGIGGRRKQTAFYTAFKRHSMTSDGNRDLYNIVVKHKKMPISGGRDNALMHFIGKAVSLMVNKSPETTTPEGIFSLLVPSVEQWTPDAGTPCWLRSCWEKVKRIYARDLSKMTKEDHELMVRRQQGEVQRAGNLKDLVTTVIQEADRLQTISRDFHLIEKFNGFSGTKDEIEEKCRQFLNRRLILRASGTEYYVMKPNGYYDRYPCSKETLHNRITELNMDKVIQTTAEDPKTKNFRPISSLELVRRHSTEINGIVSEPGLEDKGAYLTPRNELTIPSYNVRQDILPVESKDIDAWFRMMFSLKNYELFIRWIAYSIEIGKPICALALIGPSGCGKSLIVKGLAEVFSFDGIVARGNELVSDFPDTLLLTPVVHVDEGWVIPDIKKKGLADTFRSCVLGDIGHIKVKYKASMKVKNNVRIVMTANNTKVLTDLMDLNNMSEADREAIGTRILQLDCKYSATEWFRKNADVSYKDRWVGSIGTSSKNVLASHMLWLHSKKETFGPPGHRMLVEGNLHLTNLNIKLLEGSQLTLAVTSAIERCISEGHQKRREECCVLFDGLGGDFRMLVNVNGLFKKYKNSDDRNTFGNLSLKGFQSVIWKVSLGSTFKSMPSGGQVNMHSIDAEKLSQIMGGVFESIEIQTFVTVADIKDEEERLNVIKELKNDGYFN